MTEMSVGSLSDIPSLMAVMRSAFDPAYGEAWSADQMRGALSIPGCSLLLLSGEAQMKGFALVRTVLDEAELLLIAIDKTVQRQGEGQSLLDQIVQLTRDQDIRKIHVEVREDNPAIPFYINFGFIKVGERPDYYRRTDGGPTKAITLSYVIK